MKPLISVIIPIYNTGDSAVKLLNRLIKQSYENLEIICVDDGSKDGSFDLVAEFIRQSSLKNKNLNMTILRQKNQGAAGARNLGLKKASGEYVTFIDSDDEVKKTHIEDLLKSLEKDPRNALSVCGYVYRRLRMQTEKNFFTNEIWTGLEEVNFRAYIVSLLASDGRMYAAINKMFRLSVIKKAKVEFPVGWDFAEDTMFVLRYLKAAEEAGFNRIGMVLKANYIYNYGTETSTVASSSMKFSNWQKSFQNIATWAEDKKDSAEIKKLKQKWLRKLYLRFKISHALAVARSAMPLTKKWKYLNPLLLPLASLAAKIRK
ncbi:glycosyltransferase family 2 protein [Candidatus Saccharibacteria bacterium]|nr:glycosyltransferase family 2 protein [Candidatus Saccharibacteria bacterium]